MEYIDIIVKEHNNGELGAEVQVVDPSGNNVRLMSIDIEEDHDGFFRTFRIQRKDLD